MSKKELLNASYQINPDLKHSDVLNVYRWWTDKAPTFFVRFVVDSEGRPAGAIASHLTKDGLREIELWVGTFANWTIAVLDPRDEITDQLLSTALERFNAQRAALNRLEYEARLSDMSNDESSIR